MTLYTINNNINLHTYPKHTKAYQKPKQKPKNHTPTCQTFQKQAKKQTVQHINPKLA